MFDILLRGGWLVDGSGSPPWKADVGVNASRVAATGRLDGAQSRTTIDVHDKYVFPGFIDAHVHADVLYRERHVQEAALRQGVTTFIVGQDGLSHAPAPNSTAAYVYQYFGAVNGMPAGESPAHSTLAEAFSRADEASAVNVAWLVPAGTVRHQVMGTEDRQPTPRELSEMKSIISKAMDDGAVGLSTGLDYLPGCHATAAEISALCEPVAKAGGVYVSHMRGGYGENAWRGIEEVCLIAQRANIAVHVSHYSGPGKMLSRLITEARERGIDVTFDATPYLRGATILPMAVLPVDVQLGGVSETLLRLQDRNTRDALCSTWFPRISERLNGIKLSFVGASDMAWAEGMFLAEAAACTGSDVGEFVCDLLIRSELAVGCVREQRSTKTDEDVRVLLRHEAHMGGSDGIYIGSAPHPRGWGTFARFLGRHVRELGDWTWGEAALHLAGHAARRFGLGRHGLIRPGYIADLAVIDPRVVTDRATYADPTKPAVGVSEVLVAGRLVLRDGMLTGDTPGHGLRRDADASPI